MNKVMTVTAVDRAGIVSAHADLSDWITVRSAKVATELAEAEAGLKMAKERKWATSSAYNQVRRLRAHAAFLDKVKAAFGAGYTIIPNLDLTVLAVRIGEAGPYDYESGQRNRPTVGAERLPVGHGEFVSPDPEFESWKDERTDSQGKKYEVTLFRTTKDAPVDVPFVLMKRHLADKLHEALEGKIFDEIGIVRNRPKGDPVLVGRILHPKARGWDRRGVAFFLGWWFDTSELEA